LQSVEGNEGWQKRQSSGKEAMCVPNQTAVEDETKITNP